MVKNLSSLFRYFLFWYFIFVVSRCVFVILNWKQASTSGLNEILATFYHGFRLDVSMCCYITVLPVILWSLSHFLANKILVNRILKLYNIILVSLVLFITLADGELYQHWGQKLNAYASSFAKFPKEMLVFSSGGSMVKFVLIILVFITIAYGLYYKGMRGLDEIDGSVKKWKTIALTIILSVLLFVGIRGGLGKAAINQSSAFYSPNIFLNHTAVNTSWNLMASLMESSEETTKNPYVFTDENNAKKLLEPLMFQPGKTTLIFNQPQPNIVFIVLEGWTADVIEPLGGEAGVTPYFNALSKEGLLYDQFYANGNRTDKGLAATISSQPALAHSSIINNIQKFTSLPSIASSLKQKNYHSTFYYGGASEFANMKGYWLSAGYEHIIDLDKFPITKHNAEWGVHDDVLWSKTLDELNQSAAPFFATVLTLSSHEPFNVPYTSKFTGKDDADLYRNAVCFSDKALGDFFMQAKQQSWYNNTVFIILADHGHQWPKDRKAYDPDRFRIPFLILGGGLQKQYKGTVNHTIACQVDIAAMLLTQLGLDTKAFNWSRNFMDSNYIPLATFVYNDGIGIVKPQLRLVYDQESKQRIWAEGDTAYFTANEKQARAYEQLYFEEFRKR